MLVTDKSLLFRVIKEQNFIDLFQAYVPGAKLRPVRKGYLTNCPLHSDSKPSFLLFKDGWKCFSGCGHGDHIDFVSRLTGQRPANAAREIAVFYGLINDTGHISPVQRERITEALRERELLAAFLKWERQMFVRIVAFCDTIQKTLDTYGLDAPEPVLEIMRDYWPQLNHYLDILATGTDAEKLALWRRRDSHGLT